MKTLQAFKDELSIAATGMTVSDAHLKGVCIECKKPPTFKTQAEEREYWISGMCEPCFDTLFAEDCEEPFANGPDTAF